MANYTGKIQDAYSYKGIPYASIQAYSGKTYLGGTSANGNGEFSLKTNWDADTLEVSSVGYSSFRFPASEFQHVWELEPNNKEMEEVVIASNPKPKQKKQNWAMWAMMGLLLLVIAKKK